MKTLLRGLLAIAVIGTTLLCASVQQADAHNYRRAYYYGRYGRPAVYVDWYPRYAYRPYYYAYPAPVYRSPPCYCDGY
jgi:hypothetical protein